MAKKDLLSAASGLSDDGFGPEVLNEFDVAWAAEAESRIDAYDAGEMSAHSAGAVFATLRARLPRSCTETSYSAKRGSSL